MLFCGPTYLQMAPQTNQKKIALVLDMSTNFHHIKFHLIKSTVQELSGHKQTN